MSYIEILQDSARKTGSIACVGLDPVIEAMPVPEELNPREKIVGFFSRIVHKMKMENVFPGAFKLNQGFYEMHDNPRKHDFSGSKALAEVMTMLEDMAPGIPIILDYKRGDIQKSSANYAAVGFDKWKSRAITVHPYMGTDSVMPFAKYCNNEKSNGIYVLNRTSNEGAKDFQSLEVKLENKTAPLYIAVAEKIIEWAEHNPGVGAVVGATSLQELSDLAKNYSNFTIPLLIPGVGGQGGSASDVSKKLTDAKYDLSIVRISSSSEITHPWAKQKQPAPSNFEEVCVNKLRELNKETNYI